MFSFFFCGCVAGYFLIEYEEWNYMNLKDFCLTLGDLVTTYELTHQVQVRLVPVKVSIMDVCLIRAKTSNHCPSGDAAVFSIMPFSNTMEGWNVEHFLSNHPHLNANGPRWNTNKSPWHFKRKSTYWVDKIKLRTYFIKSQGLYLWNLLLKSIIRSSIWYCIIIHDKKYWVKQLRHRTTIFMMCSIFFILIICIWKGINQIFAPLYQHIKKWFYIICAAGILDLFLFEKSSISSP